MNELLEKLKAADAICKKANPCYESATLQQTAHLASIKTSSKISAAANATNTLFNIANHL